MSRTTRATLALDKAQGISAEAAKAYVAAAREAREKPSAATRTAAKAASQSLRAAQYDVARITGARGIYTLRKEDTLAIVAARFYGDGNRWPTIFEANKGVLGNPDQVLPGLTVVVP